MLDATRPPAWLIGLKVLLAGLLVTGGAVPGRRRIRRQGHGVPPADLPRPGVDRAGALVALTVPFLLDTAANAVGLYDHFDPTDDVLHFLNWFVLVGGIGLTLHAAAITSSDATNLQSTSARAGGS